MNSTAEKSLVDFLRTGKLGKLVLGIHLDTTLSYLGSPDNFVSVNEVWNQLDDILVRNKELHIFGFTYGNLEVVFGKSDLLLKSFKITYDQVLRGEIPEILDNGWFTELGGMSIQTFQAILEKYQIDLNREDHSNENVLALRVIPSNIGITFDNEDGELKMYSVIKSIWGDQLAGK